MSEIFHSRWFHLRGAVGALLLLPATGAVIFSTPCAPEGSLIDWIFDASGWILFTVYVVFRIWATLYVGGRKDRLLQTDGIYSATRNPLYFGSTCLALAGALFFQSLLLFVLTLTALAFYSMAVVRTEEEVLRQRFGAEFDDYVRRTPRFFPSFANYRRPKELTIDLGALRRETRRLLAAASLPIAAELIAILRTNPNWPHWFRLI